jgi:hypothetical protein
MGPTKRMRMKSQTRRRKTRKEWCFTQRNRTNRLYYERGFIRGIASQDYGG